MGDFSSNSLVFNLGTLGTASADAPGEDMNHAPEQVADPTQGAPAPPAGPPEQTPAPPVSQTQFSRPSFEQWPPELRQLVDSSYKEADQWALTKHNGGQLPADAGQRYNELQGRITSALKDPNTPGELTAPLAAAGVYLFSGANQAGLTGVKLPLAALDSQSGLAGPRKP